ncbi:MAG: DUF167 domain-containing protein [Acidimicrobiia bacterium]|nr:DUF167 domain-containing protein [Acidimicrobiia bacterium]
MTEISIQSSPTGSIVSVLVVPGASRSEIVGPHGATIRVRVTAAPEKGRANREAERLLQRFFGAPVTVVAGAAARRKRFLVEGMEAATVVRRIREEWG